MADYAFRLMEIATEMNARAASPPATMSVVGEATASLQDVALALIAQRQARKAFLPPSLFHEPAWDILLALYVHRDKAVALSVKQIVGLIDGPVTTSQRWIDQLVHMRLLDREENAADRRRMEIALSPRGKDAIENYLSAIRITG